MSLSQKVIARQGYTSLDLISDVGGIQEIVIAFITFFVTFWNHN